MRAGDYCKELQKRLGLSEVPLIITNGLWENYYVPEIRRIVISKVIFHSDKIAAKAIVAHEVAHALQHTRKHWAMSLNFKVPLRILHIILEWDAKRSALQCIKWDFPQELPMARKVLNRMFLTHLLPVLGYYGTIVGAAGLIYWLWK
jgi:hypothetical protein